MSVHNPESVEVSIEFEVSEGENPALKLSGIKDDLLRDPERVRRLMDVLELPAGTNARVRYIGTDVIVR